MAGIISDFEIIYWATLGTREMKANEESTTGPCNCVAIHLAN